MSDARDAAAAWATVWQRAWEAHDVDAVVALYHPDASFSSEPFRELYRSQTGVRAYVSAAFAAESDVRAWFAEPLVDGDRAAVEWWASLREDGEEVTLAGTSLLRFGPDGLVREQRDTWNSTPSRREPPPRWGL